MSEKDGAAGAADGSPRPVVAVANRLPVQRGAGGWELSPGGLVTALRPVMMSRSGTWVGWDGGAKGPPARLPDLSVDLAPVGLSTAQVRDYYHGFANRTMWPLLHNAIERPVFHRTWWRSYREVNRRFADATERALAEQDGALLWVHDYHLVLVPQMVRERRPDQRIGFFLHTPWPSPDIYARLPWRREVLTGLLGADVVSFHTEDYRRNFVGACARLLAGEGVAVKGSTLQLPDGRTVRTTTSPISIDVQQFVDLATGPVADGHVEALRRQFRGRNVVLGVDRLDYTKGIVERLRAVEQLLESRPEVRERLVFVQVAVPSRDDVTEYRDLRAVVEQTVGRINGRFTAPGQDVPVHYLYRGLPPQRLAAYYAVADVLMVTPLVDGMNLVAKEYVTVQHARRQAGTLLLSEFTGAAQELREARLCNPFDLDGLTAALEESLHAAPDARRRAVTAMARRIAGNDVHAWVASQIRSIEQD
ncbi:MAG TPA: trehalose-6-phosphate synthase [Mycobacteriales bacterium]|nr:trehalose-6-phosphate synthase [Mycobacteriales bacterium]